MLTAETLIQLPGSYIPNKNIGFKFNADPELFIIWYYPQVTILYYFQNRLTQFILEIASTVNTRCLLRLLNTLFREILATKKEDGK